MYFMVYVVMKNSVAMSKLGNPRALPHSWDRGVLQYIPPPQQGRTVCIFTAPYGSNKEMWKLYVVSENAWSGD